MTWAQWRDHRAKLRAGLLGVRVPEASPTQSHRDSSPDELSRAPGMKCADLSPKAECLGPHGPGQASLCPVAALCQGSEPLPGASHLPTPHDHDVTAALPPCRSHQLSEPWRRVLALIPDHQAFLLPSSQCLLVNLRLLSTICAGPDPCNGKRETSGVHQSRFVLVNCPFLAV